MVPGKLHFQWCMICLYSFISLRVVWGQTNIHAYIHTNRHVSLINIEGLEKWSVCNSFECIFQPTCCTLWMLQPGWYCQMLRRPIPVNHWWNKTVQDSYISWLNQEPLYFNICLYIFASITRFTEEKYYDIITMITSIKIVLQKNRVTF